MDSSIVIRTLTITPELVIAQAGGGIVADSDPAAEYEEMLVKIRPLLRGDRVSDTMSLWLNGKLMPGDLARLDPRDRGFTLGDGLFETIRQEDRWLAYLDRHLARLRHGADFLGIPLIWTDAEIETGLDALIEAERLNNAAFRITLSRGPGERGILPPAVPTPTLMITAGPLPSPAPPARLVVATITRRNEASPLSRLKTLNYLDNILARREALQRGADDAILLNTRGDIAEASVANVFALRNGVLADTADRRRRAARHHAPRPDRTMRCRGGELAACRSFGCHDGVPVEQPGSAAGWRRSTVRRSATARSLAIVAELARIVLAAE